MNRHLRLAIPRGNHFEDLSRQFELAGIPLVPDNVGYTEIEFEGALWSLEVISVSAADMGTYVERGAVQMGVMSTDAIHEMRVDVWRPYTFNCGSAPIILAARSDQTLARLHSLPHLRLATSIPRFTREWFSARGFNIEVVSVQEDQQRAVQMGLADGYVALLYDADSIVSQGFRALDQLGVSELKMVVNNATSSHRREFIKFIMKKLEEHRLPAPPPIVIPYDTEDPR